MLPPLNGTPLCRFGSCVFAPVGSVALSEILLTAKEAEAILADATANDANDPQDDAKRDASNDEGGAAAALTTPEADARREAEALAVLLSDDGGVPGAAAESALTRLAARYLVRETVRGKIPDPVGNFHVRGETGKAFVLVVRCFIYSRPHFEAAFTVVVQRTCFAHPSQSYGHAKVALKRVG